PDAVEAAGHLVAAAPELAPGMEGREHDLGRGLLLVLGVGVDRDAAAVVGHAAPAVGQEGHLDERALTGHRLVDGVVDDLPDEVVEAARAGGPDEHARPFPDGLEAL